MARFDNPHTLLLSDGRKLTAGHIVMSTGSVVGPPPLPDLNEVGYITSDDVMKLNKLPESLIVLGGGAVAVEFAQFFARFGVQVTLIQRSAHILRDFDEDAGKELENVFRREGIEVFSATRLTKVWRSETGKGVAFEWQGKEVRVEAEEI